MSTTVLFLLHKRETHFMKTRHSHIQFKKKKEKWENIQTGMEMLRYEVLI